MILPVCILLKNILLIIPSCHVWVLYSGRRWYQVRPSITRAADASATALSLQVLILSSYNSLISANVIIINILIILSLFLIIELVSMSLCFAVLLIDVASSAYSIPTVSC